MYNYFPIPVCNEAARHFLKTNTFGIRSMNDLGTICMVHPDYELEMVVAYLDIKNGLATRYPEPPSDFQTAGV